MNNKKIKVQINPITAEDMDEVGSFLHTHFNPRWNVEEWKKLFLSGWDSSQSDMGRVARVGEEVVGVIGALYSNRVINGRKESFCNIHSWVTLESHRTASLQLLMALITDGSRHYINVTANQKAYQSSRFVKFKVLESHFHAFPNTPSVTGLLNFACKIIKTPQTVKEALDHLAPGVYDDFAQTSNLQQWLLQKNGQSLHLVFRKTTWKSWSCAQIVRADPIELLQSWLPVIKTNMFFNKIAYTTVDSRFLGGKKQPFMQSSQYPVPLIYLSNHLQPQQIDNGYTDRVILDSMIANSNK
ncbi:MAG: hypothetical protein HQL69_09210 [Magnetococcales bacterium]|nr:hypothetical protein [Magnetococcales bacterium]